MRDTASRGQGRWRSLLTGLLLLVPTASEAGPELFLVYEDWRRSETIRSDRWLGRESGGLEAVRKLGRDGLQMALRREGGRGASPGFAGALNRLSFAGPSPVEQVEVDLRVRQLEVSGCQADPLQPARLFAAIALFPFNDGTGGPGNATGDHMAQLIAFRESPSADTAGVLRLRVTVLRCIDASCSNAFSLPGAVVDLPETVLVQDRFTLRLVWDAPNSRFLAGLGSGPDVAVAYPAAANAGPPSGVVPPDIRLVAVAPNCQAEVSFAAGEAAILEVRTNASAVVP
jgi:hypothetical protein